MRSRPRFGLFAFAVIAAVLFAFAGTASAMTADGSCEDPNAPADSSLLCGHVAHDAGHSTHVEFGALLTSSATPVASPLSADLNDRTVSMRESITTAPLLHPPQLVR